MMCDQQVSAEPNPDLVFCAAGGFLNTQALFAAMNIGLFTALSDGGATARELAQRCDVPERSIRIIADVLTTCQILVRDGERYSNSPTAEVFLSGRGEVDLSVVLRYWDLVSYARAASATDAVRAGKGIPVWLNSEQTAAYERSVAFTTSAVGHAIAEVYDFSGHARLLDVGGGIGAMLRPILVRHPHLSATLLDLPDVVGLARDELAVGSTAGRVKVAAADMFIDPIPPGHDVMLVANLLHLFPPDRNVVLLERLRAVASPRTRLMLVDLWRHWDSTPPPFAVYGAMEFLMISGGDTYRPQEVGRWLEHAGWRALDCQSLDDTTSMIVAEPV